MRDEAIIADGHQFADERMRLDAGAFANGHFALNFHKRADKTIVTDAAAVKIYGLNHLDVSPELHIHDATVQDFRALGRHLSVNCSRGVRMRQVAFVRTIAVGRSVWADGSAHHAV